MNTLADAIDYVLEEGARHPERDGLAAESAAAEGRPRPFPCFYLGHLHSPEDRGTAPPPHHVPRAMAFPDTDDGRLAREIVGLLAPLDMLNPVRLCLSPGGARSPGDLIPCFGTPLSEDGGAAAFTRPLAELLQRPPPDPDTAGFMPGFRARIARIKACTPPAFRIGMPDMQGPFNLAHALIGDEAFTAPVLEPEAWAAFMDRITTFWIAAHERLHAWIGPERLRPLDRWPCIAECSVNLVSAEFYEEHIRPHDLRIARHFGGLRIHPCSGRHVFHATLRGLPSVRATEAGAMIMRMAAPCIGVDEALAALGARPIVLAIGQELPGDWAEAEGIIAADLARAAADPRLLLNYTGMFWSRADRSRIRELHRRLDAAWPAPAKSAPPAGTGGRAAPAVSSARRQ
jgi:hypothetical protein